MRVKIFDFFFTSCYKYLSRNVDKFNFERLEESSLNDFKFSHVIISRI